MKKRSKSLRKNTQKILSISDINLENKFFFDKSMLVGYYYIQNANKEKNQTKEKTFKQSRS
jgi:hypothetical protein